MHRVPLGADAEHRAECYLRSQGLQTITRNFRCRLGEIDLVMRHDPCLVFVEVRYRKSARFVAPGLTVDRHKQRKLIRTAALYLSRHARLAERPARFDVVAIEDDEIHWIRDAFRPPDSAL